MIAVSGNATCKSSVAIIGYEPLGEFDGFEYRAGGR
jgi:hypothetical protein